MQRARVSHTPPRHCGLCVSLDRGAGALLWDGAAVLAAALPLWSSGALVFAGAGGLPGAEAAALAFGAAAESPVSVAAEVLFVAAAVPVSDAGAVGGTALGSLLAAWSPPAAPPLLTSAVDFCKGVGSVTLAVASGSSRSFRYNVLPSAGVGTLKLFSANPVGTSAGLEKSFAAPNSCTRNRLLPSTVHVGASALVQRIAVIWGVRTSVPSDVHSPVVPSAATGRICSLPNADSPNAFKGSSVPIAVCASCSTRLLLASESFVFTAPSAGRNLHGLCARKWVSRLHNKGQLTV